MAGLCLATCSNQKTSEAGRQPAGVAAATDLPLPEVPDSLTEPVERASFLTVHFWDAMDWKDRSRSLDTAFVEQNFANYLTVLPLADSLGRVNGVDALLHGASADSSAYAFLVSVVDKYLGDPNSPMRDEELYIPFLRAFGASSLLDGAEKARYASLLEDAMKNREGRKAEDFAFVDREGRRMTLREAVGGTEETIVMFYDPDCNVCEATERYLASSEKLNRLIGEGRLRIVAIDPFDTDPGRWKAHADSLPRNWTVGRSPGGRIDSEEIYVIRATPAIYLLDSAMTVRIKDARDDEIARWAS